MGEIADALRRAHEERTERTEHADAESPSPGQHTRREPGD